MPPVAKTKKVEVQQTRNAFVAPLFLFSTKNATELYRDADRLSFSTGVLFFCFQVSVEPPTTYNDDGALTTPTTVPLAAAPAAAVGGGGGGPTTTTTPGVAAATTGVEVVVVVVATGPPLL